MNNRVIKFRVWDKKRARYILDNDEKIWLMLTLSGQIRTEENEAHYGCILEQFTGLYDREGREIYEGDIIKMGEPRYVDGRYIDNNIGVVAMIGTQWALYPIDKLGQDHPGIIYFRLDEQPPVIGNIHQNPELLNK